MFVMVIVGLLNVGYCYESEWTTVASSDFNCLHKRNITFFGFNRNLARFNTTEVHFDYTMKLYDHYIFLEEIQKTLGICFNVNIFSNIIRKTIPVKTKDFVLDVNKEFVYSFNHRSVLHDLQMLSDEIDANHADDTKQTVVFFSLVERQNSELIFKELQKMKEKGWDIIIYCSIGDKTCPIKEWISVHLIFPIQNLLTSMNAATMVSQITHVLRNPSFNKIEWLMEIGLNSVTKSCFSGRDIVFHVFTDQLLPFINHAIVITRHLPRNQVRFRFYTFSPISTELLDEEFIKFFLKEYGIANGSITVEDLSGVNFLYKDPAIYAFFTYQWIFNNDESESDEEWFLKIRYFEIAMTKKIELAASKKRNIFLIIMDDTFLTQQKICRQNKYSKSELKNTHFYTKYPSPISNCQNKFVNLHDGVDLLNERFFETINKLACDME